MRPQITQRHGELASSIGGLLIAGLSAATKGTAGFFLDLFIMLYAMLFFLKDGVSIREKALRLTPLAHNAQERLLAKGLSVTRAALKGTQIIGPAIAALCVTMWDLNYLTFQDVLSD